MHLKTIESRFVRNVPRQLEAGILYISMEYGTAVHSCCCGCGQEIVTPISPSGWKLVFDGDSVSLSPSIGNWGLPCRSHYFIKRNRVIDAAVWGRNQKCPKQYYNVTIEEVAPGGGAATKNNLAPKDCNNSICTNDSNEIIPTSACHSKPHWWEILIRWIKR